MNPETYLHNVVPIYSSVRNDLQKGDNLPEDLKKIEQVIGELDKLIVNVEESGGKTKGYRSLKNEMITLTKEIEERLKIY